MSHGLLPYEVDVGLRADTLTGRAGLPLVVETLRALGLERVIEGAVRVRQRASGYTEVEKVEALVLLLAAGGDCVDDMAVLQADAGLGRLLGRALPSADRLRQFLYAFHDPTLLEAAQAPRAPTEVAYIPAENAALQGLGRVNVALVERGLAGLVRSHWQKAGTIELVHDVTKKELGAAVPPCGRFGANAAWYRLSLLTYNVLSALKSLALPAALSAARPKRLRFAVFTLAGRILTHAGRLVLRISEEAESVVGLGAARTRLAGLRPRIASG